MTGTKAATMLLGVSEYRIAFQADNETYKKMDELLRVIFEGLSGASCC